MDPSDSQVPPEEPPSDESAETRTLRPSEAPQAVGGGGVSGAADMPVPTTLGQYRLGSKLGAGGMGQVYAAEHVETGQQVAIKLLSSAYAHSEEAIERFRLEGRLASMVESPRCVFVLGADEDGGVPYIVMERMPGRNLSDLVREEGPLLVTDAVGKILDVIEGLRAAHRIGVLHRDVKPSNCFVEESGRVKVGDFGLAKSLVSDVELTKTGSGMGTPQFVSPEQISGKPIDVRTDVFSVCGTLYYLLTGKAPFSGQTSAEVIAKVVAEDPPPIAADSADLSDLEAIILRGLSKDPNDRWRDLGALTEALRPFVAPATEPATFRRRVLAGLIDQGAVTVLVLPWLALPPVPRSIVVYLLFILYFTVLEGRWGAGLGKWIARLRVVRADDVRRTPSGRAVFLRTVLIALPALIAETLQFLPGVPELLLTSVLPPQLLLFFLYSLMFSMLWVSAVTSPLRQALHDSATVTRVVEWSALPAPLALTPPEEPETDASHGSLGDYSIQHEIDSTDGVCLYQGEDKALGRSVWLLQGCADDQVASRKKLVRDGRLRWIASGSSEDGRWHAFLAPRGVPLARFAASDPVQWRVMKVVLRDLVHELVVGVAEEGLPSEGCEDSIYVDADGTVQVIDIRPTQLGVARLNETGAVEVVQRVMRVLTRSGEAAPCLDASAPLHAHEFVGRLFSSDSLSLETISSQLDEVRSEPARLAPRGVATYLVLAASMLIGATLPGLIVMRMVKSEEARRALAFRISAEEALVEKFPPDDMGPTYSAVRNAVFQAVASERALRADLVAALCRARLPELRRAEADWHWGLPQPLVEYFSALHKNIGLQRDSDGWAMTPSARAKLLRQSGELTVYVLPEARKPAAETLQGLRLRIALRGVIGICLIVISAVLLSFLSRGGFLRHITGLAIIRGGMRAGRFRCGLRSAVTWTPVVAIVLLHEYLFLYGYTRACWGLLVGSCIGAGLIVALRVVHPGRTYADRICCTRVVPR